MTQRRACFDFALTFSNGGGLQGQDFRLDIEGCDISDDELAAYIIKDLRLLMVKEVRILNKTIIEEPHKRAKGAVELAQLGTKTFVDLSHTIESGMVTYRGLPAPLICDHLSFEDSHRLYAPGTEFHIGRIDMVANTGTYIDTPYHRYPDGQDLAAIDLARISGLPAVLVRIGADEQAIDWKHFAPIDVKGRAVLVQTDWDCHWRTDQYFEGHPFLTEAAAAYLRDQGAALVGIDSLNIDDIGDGRRPVHSTLLRAGIPIVEHLTNLRALPTSAFTFFAVAPKVAGMGTFPVRAHAILAETN